MSSILTCLLVIASDALVSKCLDYYSVFRSPPLALQPSLGSYYASVNNQWRKGYLPQTSQSGHFLSEPLLSRVVVVSISGGYNDYQVFVYSCFPTVLGLV